MPTSASTRPTLPTFGGCTTILKTKKLISSRFQLPTVESQKPRMVSKALIHREKTLENRSPREDAFRRGEQKLQKSEKGLTQLSEAAAKDCAAVSNNELRQVDEAVATDDENANPEKTKAGKLELCTTLWQLGIQFGLFGESTA